MPRAVIRRATLAVCGVLDFVAVADAASDPVPTTGGLIAGYEEAGLAVFKGVPFAGSTAGEARWRLAPEVKPWDGVRDATSPGTICPQLDRFNMLPKDAAIGEDCLNLNIWSPGLGSDKKYPVLVWIHGGSFRFGAGSQDWYDGARLAQKGVVVVTINYRLDRFGTFAHPALSRLQAGQPLANYGIMDQVKALQWVRDNIAAFGGDPDNVTIFGQSAGGVSVNILLVTPSAEGLFHRAFAMSGGVRVGGARHISNDTGFEPPLEEDGVAFAAFAGVTGTSDEDIAAQLRALPVEAFLDYSSREIPNSINPVVDGVLIPEPIGTVFREGRQMQVPFMAGGTDYEDSLMGNYDLKLADVVRDGPEDEARRGYPNMNDSDIARAWFQDWLFLAPIQYLADRMAATKTPTYLYHTTYQVESLRGKMPGVPHGGDVPLIFGNSSPFMALSAADQDMVETIQTYVVNFARSGNPNGVGVPGWPHYTPTRPVLLDWGETVAPIHDPFQDVMDFHFARFERIMDDGE